MAKHTQTQGPENLYNNSDDMTLIKRVCSNSDDIDRNHLILFFLSCIIVNACLIGWIFQICYPASFLSRKKFWINDLSCYYNSVVDVRYVK